MSRSGISLCLLLSLAVAASGFRAQKQAGLDTKTGGGPDKCTITWKFRKDGDGESQVARVSFGVRGCRTQCLATNSDYSHEKMFPRAFEPREEGSNCLCLHNVKNMEQKVMSFPLHEAAGAAQCSPEAGSKKCWEDYQILSTDTWEEHAGMDKTTLEVVHHDKAHHEREFIYDDIACEKDGCAGEEDCFDSEIPRPSLAGRTPEEKKIIGNVLQNLANGDITKESLGDDVTIILDALTGDEKEEALALADVVAKDPEDPAGPEDAFYVSLTPDDGGAITVGVLKEAYEKRLHGTGLSVSHLLTVAGIDHATSEDLDKDLTKEAFKKFLNPDCP